MPETRDHFLVKMAQARPLSAPTPQGKPTDADMADAFAEVEVNDQRVAALIMNPADFDYGALQGVIEPTAEKDCFYLWGAYLFLCPEAPVGKVFLFGDDSEEEGLAVFVSLGRQ